MPPWHPRPTCNCFLCGSSMVQTPFEILAECLLTICPVANGLLVATMGIKAVSKGNDHPTSHANCQDKYV